MRFVSGAAHQGFFHFKFQVEDVQNLDGFCNDFGTNAVTRQNCNFHGISSLTLNLSDVSQPRFGGQAFGFEGFDFV